MDQTTTNLVFAGAAFILSVFTANWLNQRFVERMVNQNREEMRDLLAAQIRVLDAKLDAIRAEFFGELKGLNGEIKALRGALENLTARIDRLERATEQRFDRIERQLDAIFKPVISKTGD